MKIAIGCDHAGFPYKEQIIQHLSKRGIQVRDFGTDSVDAVDYPDYIRPAAQAVADGSCDKGIVLGGSGNGEAISANKVRGIRCALCWNEQTAIWSKSHNDANMISMGARTLPINLALKVVDLWLDTEFEGGRHVARVEKIEKGL
jgi:ribose 5-phosphate isomerase B